MPDPPPDSGGTDTGKPLNGNRELQHESGDQKAGTAFKQVVSTADPARLLTFSTPSNSKRHNVTSPVSAEAARQKRQREYTSPSPVPQPNRTFSRSISTDFTSMSPERTPSGSASASAVREPSTSASQGPKPKQNYPCPINKHECPGYYSSAKHAERMGL